MKKLILPLLAVFSLTACAADKVEPAKAEELIAKKAQLLDVRTQEEWDEGHLEGATRVEIGSDDFAAKVAEKFDKSKPLVVYCRSGGRSARAAKQLEELGFETVYDLKGGITAWKDADKKVVK
ncbi:rhodanese/sulfur transferase [Haloferula helveola]|uniref:Rhodanese/sulfur transferase n=1 Tax=Haloferula helveola TaxID=490095 RepID=A0ABN6H787_9BACT|nr:rhodanese/sulfur transferase [Haloferula helveola]